jgi:hypothetical protein
MKIIEVDDEPIIADTQINRAAINGHRRDRRLRASSPEMGKAKPHH